MAPVGQALKPGQAMPDMKAHVLLAQSVQPGAQQGRGFHFLREYPPRAADETLDAQAKHPLAQRFRSERRKQWSKFVSARAVASEKCFLGFRVRDVHPALAGHQELATHRWHGVEQIDFRVG